MRPQVLLGGMEPRFQVRACRQGDQLLYVHLSDVVAWLQGEGLPDTARQLREAGAELSKPPKPTPMPADEVAVPEPEVVRP